MNHEPHSSWAEVYDFAYQISFGAFYEQLTDATVSLIKAKKEPPAKIVDFGAGTGRLAIPLAMHGYDVTAVEPCRNMLTQLRDKDAKNSVTTVCSTMEDFESEESFDVALCVFTVILYLLDEESMKKSFSTAYHVLKPGGMLLIDIPTRAIFQSYSRENDRMERKVTVTPKSDVLYNYQEKIRVKKPCGQESEYSDEFNIRYWPYESVLAALQEAGFTLGTNLTDQFSSTGSYYIMMIKTEDNR